MANPQFLAVPDHAPSQVIGNDDDNGQILPDGIFKFHEVEAADGAGVMILLARQNAEFLALDGVGKFGDFVAEDVLTVEAAERADHGDAH